MILLTGAAGFIGSNILKELNARGCDDIICVDDLTNGEKCANLRGTRFYDYIDYEELFLHKFPEKFSGIIHMGANSSTSAKDGKEIVANNFTYTKRLFRTAASQECPIVYASSASVYGEGKRGFIEKEPCESPSSPYAFSKWLIDQYVRKGMVQAMGLRYFNVYGPGEAHKKENASFACKFFQAAAAGTTPGLRVVDLYHHPRQPILRDFIYVKDAVDVTLFCLEKNFVPGIYNVGTGVAHSFDNMLDAGIATLRAHKFSLPQVMRQPLPVDMLSRYQAYTCADITKLKNLGWTKPFTSLEEGMKMYWKEVVSRGDLHGV